MVPSWRPPLFVPAACFSLALAVCASAGAADEAVDDRLTLIQAGFWPSSSRLVAKQVGDHDDIASRWSTSRQRRQALRNWRDIQYFANITVGGQVLIGIIDTGSFELVVFGKQCEGCGSAAQYDPKQSASYQRGPLKRSLLYGSGDIYAREAFDLVSVGPFGAINQSIWESYEAYMPVLDSAEFQAIIGVGPPEMPAFEAWSNTARSLRRVQRNLQHKLDPSFSLASTVDNMKFSLEVSVLSTMLTTYGFNGFSLCLGNRPESNGYFIWNDTSAVEVPASFKRVPVVGRHTWTVKMTNTLLAPRGLLGSALGIGSTGSIDLGCSSGCGAIVDSGTSMILVPSGVARQLQEKLNEMDLNCSNMHEFPDLVFTLGEHTFSLPPDAYLAQVTRHTRPSATNFMRTRKLSFQTDQCELTIMETWSSSEYGPLWILGMPFFRKYYTTFSLGRTQSERALYIAKAGPDCYPATTETSLALDGGQAVFRRHVDLAHVYISPLVKKAISSEQLEL